MTMSTLTTIASTGRRTNTSANFMSVVLGRGIGLRFWLHPVIDDYRGAVPQLGRARAHHALASVQTLRDPDEIPARRAETYELLARLFDLFAVGRLGHTGRPRRLRFDDEHRITKRGVDDRGRGNGHQRSEEHTSELQSRLQLVCRLLLEKK